MSVTRYDFTPQGMEPREDGHFVLASVADALESKLKGLVEALEYWREEEDGKTRASFDDEIDFNEYKLAMADTISAIEATKEKP